MVLPTAELATSDPGAHYAVSFLTAVGDHPDLMSALDVFGPSTERYLDALARATPELPESVRVLRFAVAQSVVNRVLGQTTGVHLWVGRRGVEMDDAVESVTDMLVGIFTAPVSVAPRV